MIVLDTNVLSESMRPNPSSKLLDSLRSHPVTVLLTTTITEAERYYGMALLPQGSKRRSLESVVAQVFVQDLAGRVLPFDSAAAREYANIAATRRHAGRPMAEADARIAAIARSRGAALATRNVDDFAGCDLEVVDPWR